MRVGDTAPGFRLDGIDGRSGESLTWDLDEHAGHPRLLVFYPADNSPVCRRQLADYTERVGGLDDLGAVTVALSPQGLDSHRSFANDEGGFGFPLLADTDKAVGRAYGILGVLDLYRRSIVVVDPDGAVAYVHRSIGPGLGYRRMDDLVEVVRRTAA